LDYNKNRNTIEDSKLATTKATLKWGVFLPFNLGGAVKTVFLTSLGVLKAGERFGWYFPFWQVREKQYGGNAYLFLPQYQQGPQYQHVKFHFHYARQFL
jgi:hypothetical protein